MSNNNDVREVLENILEAAEDLLGEGGAFAKAALRNAGYLWECPHCHADTIKPDEDPVTCDGCGKPSDPVTAHAWQVLIRRETRIGDHYGYGDTIGEALRAAAEAPYSIGAITDNAERRCVEELEGTGIDKRNSQITVYARRVVYAGPKDNPSRIGLIGRSGDVFNGDVFHAYATKSHEDEGGYSLHTYETEEEAEQAIREEFDTLGPFSWRS